MSTSPGAYRPLDPSLHQIRILNIIGTQPVRCSFEYASLKDVSLAPYDAISWRWGDPKIRGSVDVDGKTISVPANAVEVLEHLCVAHKRFRVWIDTVCINQEDDAERSQQVAIMSSIYAGSRLTLVWLGQDDGTTERAIASLELVDSWRQIRHRNDDHINCGVWCQQRVTEPFPIDTDWEAILSLFSPGWFLRFWVIQEVALSKHTHVFRGGYCVCWHFLSMVAHYLHLNGFQHATDIQTGATGIANAQSIARVASGVGAAMLLEESRSFQASDPRDRAFALYGLLGRDSECGKLQLAFTPDYNKSLSEVYIDVTRASINHAPSQIGLLLYSQRLVPRPNAPAVDQEFPSWVPRYDYIEDPWRGSYPRLPISRKGPYADFGLEAKRDLRTDKHILRIRGVIVDVVAEIAGIVKPSDFGAPGRLVPHHKMLQILASFWEVITRRNAATPETELSAMLRMALTSDSETSSGKSEVYAHWDRDFRAFVKRSWLEPKPPNELNELAESEDSYEVSDDSDYEDNEWDLEGSDDAEDEFNDDFEDAWSEAEDKEDESRDEDKENAHRFLLDMFDNIVNRPLFLAGNGSPGNAARCAQEGDKICVVYGLPVPVLLRPTGDQYTLVGDVFLCGIMRGEFIKKLMSESQLEDRQQWFDLV